MCHLLSRELVRGGMQASWRRSLRVVPCPLCRRCGQSARLTDVASGEDRGVPGPQRSEGDRHLIFPPPTRPGGGG
ncbi:hypothetical protein ACOMHN_025109 [Nucella lapillus]